MHDLRNFTLKDAEECAAAFRKAVADCKCMEDVANQVVGYLYENLVNPAWKRKACALVRLDKTHAYSELTRDLQQFADKHARTRAPIAANEMLDAIGHGRRESGMELARPFASTQGNPVADYRLRV